ncbi:MAG: hypothetical protein HGA21_09540 [Burkholderiaceae bacterium]|nr:hypothetical protein [Burkholderiaceae bacterium]
MAHSGINDPSLRKEAAGSLFSVRPEVERVCVKGLLQGSRALFGVDRHHVGTARLSVVAAASLVACGNDDLAPPFTVKVIGFNDNHGNLETHG